MPGQPPSDNLPDEAVRFRLAAGDHAAFETLYHRYRLLLLSDVHRLMPSFDAHTLDDVVQQTFVRFWEHRDRISKAPNFRAILRKMVRDHAVDTLRARQRSMAPLRVTEAAQGDSPITALEREELLAQIEQICASLSPAQRVALDMKLAGLSAREIAQQVGCTPQAAKRREQAARQQLRRQLSAGNHDS